MGATSGLIRRRAARLLLGATDAGEEVYSPSDWRTHDGQYPVLLVSVPEEHKTQAGNGTIEFDCLATLRISCRVEAPADINDRGAAVAELAIERLELQVLKTLLGNADFMGPRPGQTGQAIGAFPSIEVQRRHTAEGEQHFVESQIDIQVAFAQGPEDFYDPDGVELLEIDLQANPAVPQALQGQSASLLVTLPNS